MARGTRNGALGGGLLLALALGVGCKPTFEDTDEATALAKLIEQLRPIADAECEWVFGCCDDGERLLSLGPSVETVADCSDRLVDQTTQGRVPQSFSGTPIGLLLPALLEIEARRVEVDTDALALCIASIRDRPCNVYPVPVESCETGDPLEPDDPCDPARLFRGSATVGSECNPVFGWACQSGTVCQSFGSKGVCAERAAVGETCVFDSDCEDDLLCAWAEGVCTRGAGPGQVCAYDDPSDPIAGTETTRCADGLSCDPVTTRCVPPCSLGSPCNSEIDCPADFICADQLCLPPSTAGGPCDEDEDCASGTCDFQLLKCFETFSNGEFCSADRECDSGFCSFVTASCESPLPPGQPCPSRDNDECAAGWCDTALWDMPVCTAYAQAGDPCPNFACDPEADPELACIVVSEQTEEVCVELPLADGELCQSSGHCESELCFEGECHPGATLGETCSDSLSSAPWCQAGLFCRASEFGLTGSCSRRGRAGDDCDIEENTCYGSCQIQWGTWMCDSSDPWDLEEVWCDGA